MSHKHDLPSSPVLSLKSYPPSSRLCVCNGVLTTSLLQWLPFFTSQNQSSAYFAKNIFLKLKLDHVSPAQNPPMASHDFQNKMLCPSQTCESKCLNLSGSSLVTFPALTPFVSLLYLERTLCVPVSGPLHLLSSLPGMFFLHRLAWLDLSFHSGFCSCATCLEISLIFPLKRNCPQQSYSTYCVIVFSIAPTMLLFMMYAFAYLVFCMCILLLSLECKFYLHYAETFLAHSRCSITTWQRKQW